MATAPSSREKILDVAEALFARSGYAGIGMQAVADAAGLGKSSLFHHFRGKAQLYCEVLARNLERIRERLDPVLQSDVEPMQALERLIGSLIDVLAEHPTTARMLLRALFEEDEFRQNPPAEFEVVYARLDSMLDDIRRLLERGVARGIFRDVSVPDAMQTLIGATVYHFASSEIGERILGQPLFSAEAVARRKRELIALLRAGLLAPEPRPIESHS